ncbi:MAG: endonuclease/exonuclease/phosphatase family protein, partial [Plesiomonas shigelloides]
MAATVLSSPVILVFLLVFPVFCFGNTISFTRDELLNIRQSTPANIQPVFNYSDVLLNILVGGAAALIKRFRARRRGKRAGALVKLRQRGFRMAMPSIHLANLRSLPNKTDELLLLSRANKDFSNSAVLCFTETWLNDAILDSALHLPGYQLFRADRDAESTGKSRGGGTCFYINERWCKDITVLKKMCCSDLEALFINCKPFYSPREFCSFILVSIYIPPHAHVNLALQKLADQITETEQKHPDSVLIILGDFNRANLSSELPKYRQHVTCPTRDSNILDHCYTAIRNAYHSVARAAL